MRYRIDLAASEVIVTARSSVHDTQCTWSRVMGHIEVDPDDLSSSSADVNVDMTVFDAGDFLKNRKLRKDLDVKGHPLAKFTLESLENLSSGDSVRADAKGTLRWRSHSCAIHATGAAIITPRSIEADASFELNVRDLGVTPPKILMLKVADVVSVKVRLKALAES